MRQGIETRSTNCGARAKLDPIEDIRAYAVLPHGMAFHAVAAGAWPRHSVDQDNNQGIPRWLRQQGYDVEATAFGTIASIRAGHGMDVRAMATLHTNSRLFSPNSQPGPWS